MLSCCFQAEDDMFREDVVDGMIEGLAKSFRKRCNCLPSCTSITYEFEIERGQKP